MARSRRPNVSSFERDLLTPIATPQVLNPSLDTLIRIDPPRALTEIEDRRLYHPQKSYKPATAVPVSSRTLALPFSPKSGHLPSSVAFTKPTDVAVCVRRKRRREVLFALRRTGRGAGAKRRRNRFSDVRC